MKKLNDKELAKINENDLQFAFSAEQVKSKKLEIRILEMRSQILAYEMEKMRTKLVDLQRSETGHRESRQEFMKLMQKKKKLADGWGFDPDSGEIIEGEY